MKLDVVAVALLASVALTVIAALVNCVGVPDITPVEVFRLNPVGRVPEAIANVLEPEPPEVLILKE